MRTPDYEVILEGEHATCVYHLRGDATHRTFMKSYRLQFGRIGNALVTISLSYRDASGFRGGRWVIVKGMSDWFTIERGGKPIYDSRPHALMLEAVT